MPTSEWHWEQGTKFAVEAIKTTLLLNGAAAIALLTFITNTKTISRSAVAAVVLFAIGTVLSALAFIFAYWTQLEYGNAEISAATEKQRIWKRGQRLNLCAGVLVVFSVILFSAGIIMAALTVTP
jgi:hypothetical protein